MGEMEGGGFWSGGFPFLVCGKGIHGIGEWIVWGEGGGDLGDFWWGKRRKWEKSCLRVGREEGMFNVLGRGGIWGHGILISWKMREEMKIQLKL